MTVRQPSDMAALVLTEEYTAQTTCKLISVLKMMESDVQVKTLLTAVKKKKDLLTNQPNNVDWEP